MYPETEEMSPLFYRLKAVSLVVKHSQGAEALVKAYESKLYEEDALTSEPQSIETVVSTLKVQTKFRFPQCVRCFFSC